MNKEKVLAIFDEMKNIIQSMDSDELLRLINNVSREAEPTTCGFCSKPCNNDHCVTRNK